MQREIMLENFLFRPVKTTVHIGELIVLDCLASGYPPPFYTWYKVSGYPPHFYTWYKVSGYPPHFYTWYKVSGYPPPMNNYFTWKFWWKIIYLLTLIKQFLKHTLKIIFHVGNLNSSLHLENIYMPKKYQNTWKMICINFINFTGWRKVKCCSW